MTIYEAIINALLLAFAGFEYDYSSRPQARNGRDGGKVFTDQSISLPFMFKGDCDV